MAGAYNRTIFFSSVRSHLFPSGMSQSQVDGMTALLDYIDRLEWHPVSEQTKYFNFWNAYNFATTFHETAFTMQPVTEYGSQSYLRGKRYWPYVGRGFVQMTWKANYERSDREIAENNLVADLDRFPGGVVNQTDNPEQALDLEVAACNLMIGCWRGWWTSKKLTHYLTNENKDYYSARRIVNGLDKATAIADYAEKFEIAFLSAWQTEPVELPEPELPPPMPEPSPEPEPEDELGLPAKMIWVYPDGVQYAWERVGGGDEDG